MKDLFPWYTRVKFENIMINENMCKKYSVRHKCKFIIEIYFFQKGDFIVYALMRAKNKKSVLQESKMSILESIEIKKLFLWEKVMLKLSRTRIFSSEKHGGFN